MNPKADILTQASWQVHLFVYLFLAASLIQLIWPRIIWRMSEGWKFRDAVEPSGLWLFRTRLLGLILTVVFAWFACRLNGIIIPLPGVFSR